MSRKKPLGLLQYLCLSEEERDFYQIKGYLPSDNSHEEINRIDWVKPFKNKGGRPHKKYHINERRAYCLWLIAKEMPEEARAKITNRKLIEIANTMPFRGLFTSSQQTLETSVSRGKKTLKIDIFWNSKVCVLLAEDIPKLQS